MDEIKQSHDWYISQRNGNWDDGLGVKVETIGFISRKKRIRLVDTEGH